MSAAILDKYEMVVGLEVHVQLKTNSKAFCTCSTNFGAEPNSNTCPVCLALPGALPVLNEKAVELATKAALAIGCRINSTSVFARKNYFYPDLPKGYQISQADKPIAEHGRIDIKVGDNAEIRTIGVTRLHMEEDAGKSIHDRFNGFSAIDLNRAGVPLIEIVSEPDMRSSAEAGAYLRTIKQILEYVDVSDVSMEEGSLRVDANVSARLKGETKLGTKTEVKNMNSFSGVEKALESEFERQCIALENDEKILQQTMLWDGAKGEVRPARSKEQSHDYRYFPEPDLPPLVLTESYIADIKNGLPELPAAKKERFAKDYSLSAKEIETLVASPAVAEWFEQLVKETQDAKASANWVMGEVMAALNTMNRTIDRFPISPKSLAELLDMIRDNKVSHTAGKQIFATMVHTGKSAAAVADEKGLIQVGDDSALVKWIDEVLAEMPAEAERFLAGEKKLTGVIVGAVMRKSQGRADPKKLNQLLAQKVTA